MEEEDAIKHFDEVVDALKSCQGLKAKRDKLLEYGFEWVDDGEDISEAMEEKQAKVANDRQARLVEYFTSTLPPTDSMLEDFEHEKSVDNPNYPLFRRYFKQGNQQLRTLITFGLDKVPTDLSLLEDLYYFNQFSPVLREVIYYCTRACLETDNLEDFAEIVMNFHAHSVDQGYDVYHALLTQEGMTQKKIVVMKRLMREQEEGLEF